MPDERTRTKAAVEEPEGTAGRSVASTHGPQMPAAGLGRRSEVAQDAASEGAFAEDVDLSVDLRRQLLSMDDIQLDYYTLLGVEPSADKKAIKRAYYELAAKFHPDKHFRKKLGSFKVRLENLFSRLTIAHETLSKPEARAEYDAYLEAQRRTRLIEHLLAEAPLDARRAEENVEREVQAQEAAAIPIPGGTDTASTASISKPPSLPSSSVHLQSRRDALARRLLGGHPPATSSIRPAPSGAGSAAPMTSASAMNALRHRYEERVVLAKAAEARKCVARGERALASGEIVKAANAFRIASGLAPDDPEMHRRSRESQAKADALLAETYSRQAEYEEKNGHWAAAARSWVRVCQAQTNDAHAHGRAVGAILKAGGDLRQAARLAQRVCELEPSTAGARILLAEVYIAAELTHNARREIETASKLGAHEGIIEAMLKRLGPPT